jgi:hypothetical protein
MDSNRYYSIKNQGATEIEMDFIKFNLFMPITSPVLCYPQ